MSEQGRVMLLDTNVWVDNYLEHRPGNAAARTLIARACEEGITLAYASTSTKDLFYIINSDLKRAVRQADGTFSEAHAKACLKLTWGCLNNMSELAVAAPIGESQVWLARKYRNLHDDYEDNLVLAAVELSKATYFVTGDQQLFGKCAAPTFTAEGMIAYLEHASEEA